jgi:protein phosphatase
MKPLDEVLEFGVLTDPGMIRGNNEDAVLVEPALGLAILADGMGGGNAGEVASGMATTLLANDLRQALRSISPGNPSANRNESRAFGLLRDKIAIANRSIFQAAEHQPQYAGMGTTLVVTLFYDNRVAVAHIGDSRLYRIRGGTLSQVTKDHSLLQAQIDSGMITKEQARQSKQKNIVTRAMGIEPDVETEIHEYPVQPGDVYVLCSDGLHDMVDDAEITRVLQRPRTDLQSATEELVKMANDNGGRDNVSVVLVKVRGDFGRPKGWLRRFFSSRK